MAQAIALRRLSTSLGLDEIHDIHDAINKEEERHASNKKKDSMIKVKSRTTKRLKKNTQITQMMEQQRAGSSSTLVN